MGCCGSSLQKPKPEMNEVDKSENIKKDSNNKTVTILIWVGGIAVIAGLLIWLV